MKSIIMMISKDGRHNTITMDVTQSSTPTGNHTIEYKDPLLYDVVDCTKYIHFSDYVFPNIWEVARRIVDDLRLSHPGYVFHIAPDTDRNVIAIHAVYLADVKELCQTKFIPRNGKVEEPMNKDIIVRPVFKKVVINGPATIGWRYIGNKKFVIKKADDDAYDLEKAFLMLYAKSQFDNDEKFHKWFRTNMKQFREAYDEAHPDIGGLQWNRIDAAAISKGINDSLDRMAKKLREYKEKINREHGVTKEDAEPVKEIDKPIKDKKWSEDEVNLLERRYETSSISNIAAALGRSEAAVKAKARRMGLDKEDIKNDT